MKILELYGTDYEIGYHLGKEFHNFLFTEINNNKDKIIKNEELLNNLSKMLKKDFPNIYEEIKGRADGYGCDFNTMLFILSPELNNSDEGCTTLIMKDKNKEVLFSHNEDQFDYTKDNTYLIRCNYKDHWLIGYVNPFELIGSTFGINSYGLLFSSNYIYSNDINTNKLSKTIYRRYLVDSKNINDFNKRLKEIDTTSPFGFNVVDVKNNKAYSYEVDIDYIYEYEVTNRFARSNHFILKKEQSNKTNSSLFRYTKSKELIDKLNSKDVVLKDLNKILNYKTNNYNKSILLRPGNTNNIKTVANMSYSSIDNIIYIKDYLNDEEIQIKLKEKII